MSKFTDKMTGGAVPTGSLPPRQPQAIQAVPPAAPAEGGAATPPEVVITPPPVAPQVPTPPPSLPPGSKLAAARRMNQPQRHEPEIATTTTIVTPTIATTTTVAASAPKPPRPPEKKVKKVARGYEGVPEVVRELQKTAKTVAEIAQNITKPTPAPAVNEPILTKTQRRTIDVLTELERANPDQYKGIAERAKGLYPKIAAAEAQIRRDNKDEDEEKIQELVDAEASRLEQEAQVDWEDSDFEAARDSLSKKPEREKIEKLEREVEELRRDRRREVVDEQLDQSGDSAVSEVLEGFKETLKDIPLEVITDNEAAKKFIKGSSDRILAECVVDAAREAKDFAEATVLAFNGDRNHPMYGHFSKFAHALEQDFASRDPEQTRDERGRQFMPRAEWLKLSKEERANHWVLTPDVVITFANDRYVDLAKEAAEHERERLKEIASSLGYVPAAQNQPTPKPNSPTSTEGAPRVEAAPLKAVGPSPNFLNRLKNGTGTTMLAGRARLAK